MSSNYKETFVTVGSLKTALKNIDDSLQIFVRIDNNDALIEIVEVTLRLPKDDGSNSYVILET